MKASTASKLKNKAVQESLTELLDAIKDDVENMHPDTRRAVLVGLIDLFDEIDQDDNFGTEGWRHAFGFEH